MITFKGPYTILTHGKINDTYYNYSDLGFVNFGYVQYSNINIPDHYWVNKYNKSNDERIFVSVSVKFSNGITLNNVPIYVIINKIGSSKPITIIPNEIALWNTLNASQHTIFIKQLKDDAIINKSLYSRIKSDKQFANSLNSLDIDKHISFHQLFNNPIAKAFFLWNQKNGFCHNDIGAKFDIAGRKATEELIIEYIETEKVYRTDPLRDKIDDAIHLMNTNGDKLTRQLWYFNNRL